jgi:hypothetical protein
MDYQKKNFFSGESKMKGIINVYLLLSLWFLISGNVFLRAAVPQAERDALIALYYNTGGDYWKNNTGWLGAAGSENSWFGVTVENINGLDHVTKIALVNNKLTGSIPAELGNLTQLQYIYFDYNKLNGPVTGDFTNLTNLKKLVLDNNLLTGCIPAEIALLTQLETLGLNNNRLDDVLPDSLGSLQNLQKLRLGSNRFTGEIPAAIKNLGNLTSLEINYNGLHTSRNSVKAFLDSLAPGWELTQTMAPTDVSVAMFSGTSVEVKWTPIVYTGNEGYYEVLYRTGGSPIGEYVSLGKTADKSVESIIITGFDMVPGTTYYFVVRTWTFPHENNLVSVTSENSSEVVLATFSYTLTVQSEPADGAIIMVSPADINGESSDTANFTRTYGNGTSVTLVAAESLNGDDFRMWEIRSNSGKTNFAQFSREISLTVDADYSLSAVYKQPEIWFSHTYFHFGGKTDGASTPAQEFLIGNGGGGTVDWVIADKPEWLTVSPTSGSSTGGNSQFVTVSVDTYMMEEKEYEGTITVTAEGASNSPQEIKVTLIVTEEDYEPPFGSFDTPADDSTVSSSIAVSGWILDNIGIEKIEIFREDFTVAPGELVYVGEAVQVEGARPDVEAAFPGYPMNHKAGWGYMMLTNAFHDSLKEPRQYKLHVIATDFGENEVNLGSKTITINNRDALTPFGAIDDPSQGGRASGGSFKNRGWVLTPPVSAAGLPKKIPVDGSTIYLYVDGMKIKEGAEYNMFRADIAGYFPGYENSDGALAFFELDTTAYDNGIHVISWSALDSLGYRDGIGSRFFVVDNNDNTASRGTGTVGCSASTLRRKNNEIDFEVEGIPVDKSHLEPIGVKKGFESKQEIIMVYPDPEGRYTVEINPSERLEIHLSTMNRLTCNNRYFGYRLPIGSTIDSGTGIFYWQPGPGFLGNYRCYFIKKEINHRTSRKIPVTVRIISK